MQMWRLRRWKTPFLIYQRACKYRRRNVSDVVAGGENPCPLFYLLWNLLGCE